MLTKIGRSIKRRLKNNKSVYGAANNIRSRVRLFMSKDYLRDLDKLLKDIDETALPKKIKMPQIAVSGITNICNLNCPMCQTNTSDRPKGYMKPETFSLLLSRLKEIGIDLIGISIQGEPFLHRDLNKLLEIARSSGFKVWIGTNGQFPDRLDSILKIFPDIVSYIRFSIDGSTKKTYEEIRRGGSFEKILESLEVIHGLNKAQRDFSIKLYIEAVLNMANVFELPGFFNIFGKYCLEQHMDFNIIDSVAPDTSYFWQTFPFRNLVKKQVPCYRPFETMSFTYSGKVTLCCQDYNDELVVGDIHKDSIKDIWNGKDAELIRKKHLDANGMDIKICQSCFRPYKSVHTLTNRFIHFLHERHPDLSGREFGEKVLAFLKGMDEITKTRDAKALKKFILKSFS